MNVPGVAPQRLSKCKSNATVRALKHTFIHKCMIPIGAWW